MYKLEHPPRPTILNDSIFCDSLTSVTECEINDVELGTQRPSCDLTNDIDVTLKKQANDSRALTAVSFEVPNFRAKLLDFLSSVVASLISVDKYKMGTYKLTVIFVCIFGCLVTPTNAFCAPGCTCDDLVLSVRCTNASLAVIPYLLNPQVKYLKLLCNSIESVGQSLAFYPDITTLDLGHNVISSIEESDFEAQKKLTTLKLNNNQLTEIKGNSFKELGELIELHLHNNLIHIISNDAFVGLTKLAVLDLSNNKLKVIHEGSLQPLISLQRLYLNYNDFQQVPVQAINVLPSLRQLQLNGNELSDVPPRSFQNLTNLLTINLDKNRIGLVAADSFYGLNSLSFLSLSDNRLPYIPGRSFQNLRNLTGLDLSGNMFQAVDKHSVPSLPKLTLLRIGRSPRLTRVTSNAFVRVPSLEVLDLSQNARLAVIDDKALSVLPNLKKLDLTACSLVYIDPNQMPRGRDTKLHLAGNPFHCNCSLLWLAKLPLNSTLNIDGPTCATPPKFQGMGVHEVNLKEAGCSVTFGWPAITICVSIVLLGFLVIGVFLATRSHCSKPVSSGKTLPRDDVPKNVHMPPQYPPPPPFNNTLYGPKAPLPTPPVFRPVRPILPSPAPSPTHQALLPADWMFPSPYDDDTHWYSTVGKDGREYLTGELPIPRPPVPPPPTDRLKRNPSICRPSASVHKSTNERIINNLEGPPLDTRGLPLTYI